MNLLHVFVFLLLPLTIHAQVVIQGQVRDRDSRQSLPFASVVDTETGLGTMTDIDGNFRLRVARVPATISITYVGYEPHEWQIRDLKPVDISLKPLSVKLQEVTFRPGESPADLLMKRLVGRKDTLNPKSLPEWQCNVYQRMVMGVSNDSFDVRIDTNALGEIDSSGIEAKEFLERSHLFLNESVTKRSYKRPGKYYDEVQASRTSGLKNPIISSLTTQLQSLSFYEEDFQIMGIEYINPVTRKGLKAYMFDIEDTTFSGADTVLILSFRPWSQDADGMLQGQMRLNKKHMALESVIAEPFKNDANRITIRQMYERVDSQHWFPTQQHADIVFDVASFGGIPMVMESRSYTRDFDLNPQLRNRDFGAMKVDVARDFEKQTDTLLSLYRERPMDKKDSTTYRVIDSIGKELKLDRRIKGLEALVTGKWRIGKFDFDLNRLMAANQYEGFRLGLGLQTNEQLVRWWQIGGYAAWGFKDAAFKFQVFQDFVFHQKSKTKLRLSYTQDIAEVGGTHFELDPPLRRNDMYRNFAVSLFDSIQDIRFLISGNPVPNLSLWASAANRWVNPTTNYRYTDMPDGSPAYTLSELTVGLRWGIGEKFMAFGQTRLSLGSKLPVVWLQVTRGVDVLNGDFSYTRMMAQVEERYNWKRIGTSRIMAMAGWIPEDAPLTLMFNGRGSYTDFSIVSRYAFETMLPMEFVGDRFVYGFFNHSFPRLYQYKRLSAPYITVFQNLGWSDMRRPDRHQGISRPSMSHGFFESGLAVEDLITLNLSGFGVGVFYRYGAYASPQVGNNFYLKMAISFRL